MSDTIESLHNKIERAGELESVVRTMKALAASSMGEYENSVRALDDYYRTVELGLAACFHQERAVGFTENITQKINITGAVVFGSDQGLVGQFNDVLADFVAKTLIDLPGKKQIWAVGERMYACLADTDFSIAGMFEVPNSVHAITPLVGQILTECEVDSLYIFHNRPISDALYEPVSQRLLPLDQKWRCKLAEYPWPTPRLPEVLGDGDLMLSAFVREYLFVSLFRACAESLASENGSRLAAMQRAERNINEMLEDLKLTFHRLRQTAIDEELFDVISGFEALTKKSL